MTTKHSCLILYSHKDIQSTGSAMTCPGFVSIEEIETDVFEDVIRDDGYLRTVQTKMKTRNLTLTDHHDKPLPDDVIVWDYKIVE